MLDTQSIETLIRDQIRTLVEDRVNAVIADGSWMKDIESKITNHVQDRITARFSNIESVPDLIATVKTSVGQLFDQGRIPGLGEYIDEKTLDASIDSSLKTLIQNTINGLTLDQEWISRVEALVNQTFAQKISTRLNEVDFNSVIVKQVDASIDRWYDRLRNKFETAGIIDTAKTRQLTVMDGVVVAEGQVASSSLLVDKDAEIHGTLTVDKLVLKGDINVDNRSWQQLSKNIADQTLDTIDQQWRENLISQVLEIASTSGIDFQSVSINGQPLVSDGKLSSSITDSSLSSVGTLDNLRVAGEANLFNTLHVSNRRIGVNTQNPEMSLGVWDEEVAIGIGKHSQSTAYVGTTRAQGLVLGVNKNAQITVDVDGLTTIKQLRVGQFRIGHATEVPGYAGNRGDMLFNSDPKPGQPFAWVCLGSYKWQPLKSA